MTANQSALHSHTRSCTLVIMAKAPKPGMVKTRLTKSLPLFAVTALYRCLLADTIELAKSLGEVKVEIVCPGSDVDELVRLAGDAVDVVAQRGEGLAAGLSSVFAHFASGKRRVVAFNSDSPHLPASILNNAFQTLDAYDVVVGPTHDGGYYLVGAKAAHSTLFEGDGMGTRSALERLLARTKALDLSTGLIDPFYDIDVADDLVRLADELRLAPKRAPRTAAWFTEWKEAVAQLTSSTGNM